MPYRSKEITVTGLHRHPESVLHIDEVEQQAREARKSNRKAKAAQAIREQQRQYRCETLRFACHLGGDDGRAQRPRETRVGARAHRRAQLGLQAAANVIVFAQAARKVISRRGDLPHQRAHARHDRVNDAAGDVLTRLALGPPRR